MASYRAKSMGQHPDGSGRRVREDERIEWEFGQRGPPKWLELVAAEASPAPVLPEEIEAAPEPQAESESAPAESKRNLRNRKVAKGAE